MDTNSKADFPPRPVLLVVDDEEGPRASLKIVFKNDFDVHIASNGREAIEIAKEYPPAVAILDILMPGMSGVELLKQLKDIDGDMEVIMLTAYETLETARQALRFGAREYLNKPFDIPALRQAVAKALERRNASRELKNASERLKQVQADISRTASASDVAENVVHDLNNPLTVISGFVELLNKQVHTSASLQGEEMEKMRTNIARVHSQVVRCLEISRRYLGKRRKEQVSEERAAVNEVLFDLQELLQRHPSTDGNSLVFQELPQAADAAINSTDLLRVLLNLSTNALQAADFPHAVEVTANPVPPGFDFGRLADSESERFVGREALDSSGPLVAIMVRDTGPGIPPSVVPRLFVEQFTTKAPGKGTGLGLGSVRAIISAARGAVHMITAPGRGTTFTVYLPVR